jgi:hypothetical protein
MCLFDENGERIRSKENKETARLELAWINVGTEGMVAEVRQFVAPARRNDPAKQAR